MAQFPSTVSLQVVQTLAIQVVNPGGTKSNTANFVVFDGPYAPQLRLDAGSGIVGHPIKDAAGNFTQLAVDFTLANDGATAAFNVDIGVAKVSFKSGSTTVTTTDTTTVTNPFTMPANTTRKIRLVFPYDPAATNPTLGLSVGTDFPQAGLNFGSQTIFLDSSLTGPPGDGIPAECNASL